MKRTFLSLIALVLFVSGSLANGEPQWKVKLENKAEWLKVTSVGTVIIATNNSLLSIDPVKKEKVWEIKGTGVVDKEKFVEIEGTSFILFESTNAMKSLKAQTSVIDFITGRTIYNNVEADVTVLKSTPLLDIGAILLEIKQSKKVMLTLVDIASGKEEWRMDLPNRKTGIGLGALKQAVKSMFVAEPVADKDGHILFPDDKNLQRIDGNTGKVLWTNTYEKAIGRLNFSDDGNAVYIGSGRKITALNLSDGSELWKDPLKIAGEFQMFIPSTSNKMYVVTSTELHLVDVSTGKASWKKPASFDLPFTTLRFTPNGILVLGGNEKESMFDYIAFDGSKIWKRAYRTSPVVSFELTSKGLLYATAEEANIIDLKTGDDSIWKKRIKLKGYPVTFINEEIGLIYADEKLYRINMENFAYELLVEDIKFKGDKEDVQKIELRSTGYVLSSQQNMWLISPAGKVVYSKYYKPASLGTAMKILGVAGQVYATATNLEATQDPNSPNTINIQRSKRGDEIVHGIGNVIANRKKSFDTQDVSYIMTRVEDGTEKRVGMVKVDKDSGEEKGQIILKSLEPMYEVDAVTGNLFVIVNDAVAGGEFSCFSL